MRKCCPSWPLNMGAGDKKVALNSNTSPLQGRAEDMPHWGADLTASLQDGAARLLPADRICFTFDVNSLS